MYVFPVPGDAVWYAGDRPHGLAEKHHLQTLRSQQQADHLVLAGVCPQAILKMFVMYTI